MSDKDKLYEKARRLKALADNGVDGEKDNAKKMLDEFLAKHNIDISEIDISKYKRNIKINEPSEQTIISNVIMSVNPYTPISIIKNNIVVILDDIEYIEVMNKFKYFVGIWRNLKRDLNDLATMAFFSKYQSFFVPDEEARSKKRRESSSAESSFEKAKREAESFNQKNNSEEDKVKDDNKDNLNNMSKENADKQIQRQINLLKRMGIVLPLLPDVNYVKSNKTIS